MFDELIIRKTLRVPRISGSAGDSTVLAHQLDATLLNLGFTASAALLDHVAGLTPNAATALARRTVDAVRGLIGDHVEHNPYFMNFPANVPDTIEFWTRCLRHALGDAAKDVAPRLVNLLDLPEYGCPQHTFAEMVAAHDELIAPAKDRLTVVHLGGEYAEELYALYEGLLASTTPLGEEDLATLRALAPTFVAQPPPDIIATRENRAVLNAALLRVGRAPVAVDTVTDVLRLACELAGGDVTLRTATRFGPLPRRLRRALMTELDRVVAADPAKLADVARFARRWQRLGERLHPHEYDALPAARDVFAVARGERTVRSLAGRIELAFADGDIVTAAELLAVAPGMLLRQLDRLLRNAAPAELPGVLDRVAGAVGSVSGRVLLSVREELANRVKPGTARIFINRTGTGWVTDDDRVPLQESIVDEVAEVLDRELAGRLPAYRHLLVDPEVRTLAVPLSGRASEDGFRVFPRGSLVRLDGGLLRIFTYWRQEALITDFDLSVLLLDKDFGYADHVSWTNYHAEGVTHSGDITTAPDGATEFADISLAPVTAHYVVPTVQVYSGEGFEQVAESMFGFMARDLDQRGRPFEPSTVRARSTVRGNARVAIPAVFYRDDDGAWWGKWLHLYVQGTGFGNVIEHNRLSTALLARTVIERDYLPMGYLIDLLRVKADRYTSYEPGMTVTEPVTFIGVDRPEGLPAGSTVITLDELGRLIPG
ncbi:MAG TPA: TerD family protein [Pseudonocardiaceae bacterium]|jgi:hypothetical protein|nr:TerD family protein [Pseudonocardiaceae bacterium]